MRNNRLKHLFKYGASFLFHVDAYDRANHSMILCPVRLGMSRIPVISIFTEHQVMGLPVQR